jgi:hypothetical protein
MRACLKGVNKGESDNGEKNIQRIDGCRDDAWTMDNKKKKRKEKRKRRRRGRRRSRRRRGPLRKIGRRLG